MKRPTALLAAALFTALPLFAQEKAPESAPEATPATPRPLAPEPKDPDRLDLMPSKPAQLLPPPAGLPLIPEIPMPQERPRPSPVESPIKKRESATADAEDQIKLRIRMREAKTKAQRDPALQAEWDRSNEVKTDYEKREVLKGYYKLLAARMTKVDPTLKVAIEKQTKESLSRLEQTRIAPTQPPAGVATGPQAAR